MFYRREWLAPCEIFYAVLMPIYFDLVRTFKEIKCFIKTRDRFGFQFLKGYPFGCI